MDTHHMNVTYNASDRTYSVLMTAEQAHVLIWGGTLADVDQVDQELRRALVQAEDSQMPESTYHELFA